MHYKMIIQGIIFAAPDFWILEYQLVLNNIIVLITRSHLSIAQVSSSFKCLDMRTSMSTTPTFKTEALRLVSQLQLF